jgi:hypothetical protein
VLGNIPPSQVVREAWGGSWNTGRKRAAIKAILRKMVVNPQENRRCGFTK